MSKHKEEEFMMRNGQRAGTVEDIFVADGLGNIWCKCEGVYTSAEAALKQAKHVEPNKDWRIMKRTVTYGPLTEVSVTLPEEPAQQL